MVIDKDADDSLDLMAGEFQLLFDGTDCLWSEEGLFAGIDVTFGFDRFDLGKIEEVVFEDHLDLFVVSETLEFEAWAFGSYLETFFGL